MLPTLVWIQFPYNTSRAHHRCSENAVAGNHKTVIKPGLPIQIMYQKLRTGQNTVAKSAPIGKQINCRNMKSKNRLVSDWNLRS